MRILLLGGTGAMGTHLSEILTENRDNQVYITTRRDKKNRGNIFYIKGNAHDNAFLKDLLKERWDVIVDFMVYSTDEFRSRVQDLLNATNQYVYLSSSRVYAESALPIKEDSPRLLDVTDDNEYRQTDEYALTKARQENILTDSKLQNWTIIRPYITYAENRLQLGVLELIDWLPRALQGRTIVFSNDIADKTTTLTYGFDVACGISGIIGIPKALGKTYHITGNDSLKWSEILDIYINTIEEKTGRRPAVKMVDDCPNLKDGISKYQVMYDRHYNRIFDSSAISEFCDLNRFCSVKDGLKKCIATYIDEHPFPEKIPLNIRRNAEYDLLTGEYTPFGALPGVKKKLGYLMFRFLPKISTVIYNYLNKPRTK